MRKTPKAPGPTAPGWAGPALWMATALWAGAILRLSALGAEQMPQGFGWDKLNHFAAFAAGGWLVAKALEATLASGPLTKLGLAAATGAAFGALDETIQLFSPGRSGGDIWDWGADILGALAGATAATATTALACWRKEKRQNLLAHEPKNQSEN